MSSDSRRVSVAGLAALFAVTISGVMGATLVSPAIPEVAAALSVAPTTAGLVLSTYTLPGVVVAPLVGVLADRYGRRRVLLPCLVLHALAGGACVFAPSFGVLLILRLLQGVGSAGLVNMVVVTLGDLFTGVERARMIGFNAAVLTVGTTTFPTAGGLLASRSWRLVFVPFWAVLLVAFAVWALVPSTKVSGAPSDADVSSDASGEASTSRGASTGESAEASTKNPATVGNPHTADASPSSHVDDDALGGATVEGAVDLGSNALRQVVGDAAVRRIMLRGFALFLLIYGGILASVPVLLSQKLGAGPGLIGLYLTAGSLASMVMSALGGRLRQRYSPSSILLVAFLAYAVGMVGLATVAVVAVGPIALASIAACGIGEGMAIVLLQTRATEVAPAGLRGTSVAMFVASARLGQSAGPVAAKLAVDRVGFGPSFLGYAALAALMAAEQLRRVIVTRGTWQLPGSKETR